MTDHASFTVLNDADVRVVLSDAAAEGVVVTWVIGGGERVTGHFAAGGGGLSRAGSLVSGSADNVELTFVVYGIPIQLCCRLTDGGLAPPFQVHCPEARHATRVRPPTEARLEWYECSQAALRPAQASLLELATTGARSFHPHGAPLPPSTPFPATIVAGDATLHTMVEARSKRETSGGIEIGLRFPHNPVIPELMLRTLFPRMTLRRHADREQILSLFERSGYLRLREGTRPSDAWFGLDADAVSRDLTYLSSDGEPIGHTSMTRAYSKAWLAHQTAMLARHPESVEVRRQMLLSIAILIRLLDHEDGHALAYYDRSLRYGQTFFEAYVRSVDPSQAVTHCFDRFERNSALPLPRATGSFRAEPARQSDLLAVAALARTHLPPLLADTLDIDPLHLRAAHMHPAYVGTGLSRSREVFVVRDGDNILGAALCELTTRELSLFNTMNMAHVFMLDSSVPDAAHLALQCGVRDYYLGQGIVDPIIAAPVGNFKATLDPAVELAETMGCIAWGSLGARSYENFLKMQSAWLGKRAVRERPHAKTNQSSRTEAHDERHT